MAKRRCRLRAPWSSRGQIAFDEGDGAGAVVSYREAVAQLTSAGADRVAGEVWFELAGALDRVGEAEEAKAAYRNAAAAAGLAVRAGAEPAAAVTAAAGPSVGGLKDRAQA